MLSKRVCRKCCESYRIIWQAPDEKLWSRGIIRCPTEATGPDDDYKYLEIHSKWPIGKIPPYCPYVLEQLMEMQKGEEYVTSDIE